MHNPLSDPDIVTASDSLLRTRRACEVVEVCSEDEVLQCGTSITKTKTVKPMKSKKTKTKDEDSSSRACTPITPAELKNSTSPLQPSRKHLTDGAATDGSAATTSTPAEASQFGVQEIIQAFEIIPLLLGSQKSIT